MFAFSPAQKAQFDRDGYLVLKNFFTEATELKERADKLLKEFDLTGHPGTIFSSGEDGDDHVGDDYFLTSGDKIRFFFEPTAFSASKEDSSKLVLNRAKELAVNKIGHALHQRDPLFASFTLANPSIKSVAAALFDAPAVVQSMIICKQPEVGAAVNSHDDSTFLYTNPTSAVGMWFALEDCTSTNGCLSFLPGSHRLNEPIRKRLVRVEGGKAGTKIIPWGEQIEATPDWDSSPDWKVEECSVGDMVLIHGSVTHRSERNLSQKSRFIYTFHLIDSTAQYDELNWLQPTKEYPFSKLAL